MTFVIRPFAGEYDGVAAILNTYNTEPMTPEQLEAVHARFPAEGIRMRFVAVDEASDQVIGYGNVSGRPTCGPGTAPGMRRCWRLTRSRVSAMHRVGTG